MHETLLSLLTSSGLAAAAASSLDSYGSAAAALVAAAVVLAFVRQILFEPVREGGAVGDLGALRDPRPLDALRRR